MNVEEEKEDAAYMPTIDPAVIAESVKNGAIYAGAVIAESTNAAA